MREKGNSYSSVILVVLAAAVLAAASIFLLLRQHEVDVENAQIQLLAKGRTTLEALAAGIRAQSRRGMYRADRLAAIFDELVQTPGILALQLRSKDGTIVASGGEFDEVPFLPPGTAQWEAGRLLMTISADFAHPRPRGGPPPDSRGEGGFGRGARRRGEGRGRGGGYGRGEPELGDTAWQEGPHILTVALDTGDLQVAIRNARLRLAGGAIVVLLAIGSGAWAFVSQLHQRRLATDLLLAEERVAQSERLARLGAGLAHETKNPLGIVRGLAQSILEVPDANRETRNMAQQIVDESDRTVGQINSFLGFARPLEPELQSVNLTSLLDKMKPLFEAEARGKDIAISCEGNDLTIRADEALLRRALMNLVINAIRAVKATGSVAVRAERTGNGTSIVVEDTGCGIDPEDMGRLTDPYFGRFEGGSGLGLAIVDQISRAHGWRLTFHSQPGSNTQVCLEGLTEVL
ncbi:MAG: ATP-binding protein [Candidatus Hydrogenedentota bacterium]